MSYFPITGRLAFIDKAKCPAKPNTNRLVIVCGVLSVPNNFQPRHSLRDFRGTMDEDTAITLFGAGKNCELTKRLKDHLGFDVSSDEKIDDFLNRYAVTDILEAKIWKV